MGRAQFRTMDKVRALFGGLELVEPGLVPVTARRPDPPAAGANRPGSWRPGDGPAPASPGNH